MTSPARRSHPAIAVYLERGTKRTFACAVEWPGWCRGGRDEASALRALLDAGPRYARALKRTRLGFAAPKDVPALRVVLRVAGDATTDFGAPGATPSFDEAPMDDATLQRARAILRACWRAFDDAFAASHGRTLAKGPRGGGRTRATIVRHCLEADAGYLGALGWKYTLEPGTVGEQCERTHQAMFDGLAASARGEIPARGPRGGVRWKPRKIVRRSAWHWLDHAWEIEDRSARTSTLTPGSSGAPRRRRRRR